MNRRHISIVTGYYGSGKTSFAVNLALNYASGKENVTVIDLDTVNPYFRTSDLKDLFDRRNIELIAPVFAGTNLDLPALPASIGAAVSGNYCRQVILDVGGDDAGATPLGVYCDKIALSGYQMYYMVNFHRLESETSEQAMNVLRTIEMQSRLKVTHLVGNSNLGAQTTVKTIQQSLSVLEKLSAAAQIPIACVCAAETIADSVCTRYPVFAMKFFERGGISNYYA